MRARFSGLTAIISLIALALMLPVRADVGSSIKGGGGGVSGIWAGSTEWRDNTVLSATYLSQGDFTSTTNWTAALGFSFSGGKAVYAHNASGGTLTQTPAAAGGGGGISWYQIGVNRWFTLTYTTSAITNTGSLVCVLTNAFPAVQQTLNTTTAGTYSIVWQAGSSTTLGNFVVSCTSVATETISFDDLVLKATQGGDLTVQGRIFVAPGTTAAPSISTINKPNHGFMFDGGNGGIGIVFGGVRNYSFNTAQFAPGTVDTYDVGEYSAQFRALYLSRGIAGAKTKVLTDGAAATPVIRVAGGTNEFNAGEVIWSAQDNDGTDYRVTNGRIRFSTLTKSTTPTCSINVVGTDLAATSAGATISCTWTNVVNGTNCDLSLTCTDATAGSQAITAYFRAEFVKANGGLANILTYP